MRDDVALQYYARQARRAMFRKLYRLILRLILPVALAFLLFQSVAIRRELATVKENQECARQISFGQTSVVLKAIRDFEPWVVRRVYPPFSGGNPEERKEG